MASPLRMKALSLIYPLPDVELQRTKPLEVLALGIPRSGTEPLRNALVELGYNDVHHGFRFTFNNRETFQWLRLAWAQKSGNASKLTTEEFDKVLGDCAAVTDQPSCGFAHELLSAYPDAKVVLNYRDDVDTWHELVSATTQRFRERQTYYAWLLSWFQSDLFWQQHVSFYWCWERYFDDDFGRNGKKWYTEHYRKLEERLKKDGRPYLKWKVEDGWEPLCDFLGKENPETTFPNDKTPRMYGLKMATVMVTRRRQAERNMKIFGGVSAAVALVLLSRLLISWRKWSR